ncbi:MAG: hypothetical protein WCS70_15515, partial [Verrucomicrobiota bacterium]
VIRIKSARRSKPAVLNSLMVGWWTHRRKPAKPHRYEIERAARTSVALDKLCENHRLGSLTYYYESVAGNEYQDIVASVIPGNTLLTGRNIPVAGECEVKNCQAMKIMDSFGVGGSFSEFYLADFKDDVVYLGHEGPAHFAIAEGESVAGPVLQIGNTNSRYKFNLSATQFMNDWSNAGPAHHCAIGVGHIASKLEKFASILGIECKIVC